jgi:pimeloyl-ACP methyl ester carboxylesterase
LRITIKFTVPVLVIVLTGIFQIGCAPGLTRSDPEDMAQFATQRIMDEATYKLAYVEVGDPSKPRLIFIHGTPGSWHAFEHLLRDARLRACCHMIAIDRPGFGRSAHTGILADYADQSSAISGVLRSRDDEDSKAVVIGHSLGGTIATHVALTYPDQVGALMIISSALDPELSTPRWYHRLADLPVVKHLMPSDLHLANQEMLTLQGSLFDMQPDLSTINMPVTIIQGGEDPLVDPDNPKYAEAHFENADLNVHRFPTDGHFIIWEQPEFIVSQILGLVRAMEP